FNGSNNGSQSQPLLTVTKKKATVTLSNLNQTYDGTAKSVTAMTLDPDPTPTPINLTVILTYSNTNGPVTSPTNVGSYGVVATVADANYDGTASGTLNVQYLNGGTCNGDAGHQILQPVNADGSSVFKQGSVVPLKFRVCDAGGHS